MMESYRSLRGPTSLILLGVIFGGALVVVLGPQVLWGMILLAAAALLIGRFISFQPPVVNVSTPSDDPLAILPPLTRLLFERLPLPVMLLDGHQKVLLVNHDMRMALGPGLERRHVSGALRNPDALNAIAEAQASGEPAHAAFSITGPVERHYEAYAARIDGGLVALLLHDVTAIRRSEQMRADFVANASHELRTPLAAVTGFIETLRGPAREDDAAREQFLGIMASESGRMRRLIDDLLSLTRIELNEHVRPEAREALEPIVQQASNALIPLAREEDITVTIRGEAPDIKGDHDELVQLFQNLIHNAIKYGRPGGEVTVTLGRENGHALVAVKDDGEGIPRAALPRLTERFYRVDVKRSRERGGTGLGLAIVKHIVSRHDGRLAIDSVVGEGSTFTVTLPAMAPPEAPEKPVESEAPVPVTEVL
ncbi:MAG TPA: ATP-binding protein [Rhizomicrobium sp.]|nr:ATP-binding protein [Rhizomicrobium sp.]